MQDLEWYALGGGIVIVNVTKVDDVSDVTRQMSTVYTWDSIQFDWTPDDEEGGPSEWLALIGAIELAQPAVA